MSDQLVVLLVEADDVAADEVGTWVTDAGHWLIRCRGPHEPSYVCRGWTDQHCLLADASDVVIVDMHLDTDAALSGPPAWEFVSLYRSHGKPVIVLGEPGSPVHIVSEPGVAVLPHRPDRKRLLSALAAAVPSRAREKVAASDIADLWL